MSPFSRLQNQSPAKVATRLSSLGRRFAEAKWENRRNRWGLVTSSIKWLRKILFLLWIGVLLALVSTPIRAEGEHWKDLGVIRLPGRSPPDFTLPSLDGGSVTLSDLKGKVVLINFWATWCGPCREEMPSMERLYRRLKYRDFTILAVDIAEHPETVKEFARRYDLSFPILLDTNGEVSGKYMANAIPTTYIIDKEGKAVGKAIGARKWNGERAIALIEELLKD